MALDEIAEKAKEYRRLGKKLHLSLIYDDISIRKQVQWDNNTKSFDGFPTKINSNSKQELSVSKEALVFMVVGPNFKTPAAYFFLNGLQAINRAALVKEVIIAINDTGAKVISLTGDALSANITVANLLGADFKSKRPFFTVRPNEKVYVIFDPPHMLKLVRKYFAYYKLYYKDEQLKWELIVKVANMQDCDNFELGNKISRSHLNFSAAPMNVRLAAQTMSNSVANILEQLCEDVYEDLIESAGTIQLL